jgi:catechol 2,3-dioxygenase-like lactoylglutathione lyase family enzyme
MDKVRIGSIVINTADVRPAAEFWAKALGYVPRPGMDDGWALLVPEDGNGPNLAFDRGDRTHLDLYAANGKAQQAEVERLIGLGAKRVEDWPYPDGADFVVLADPVGNLFCVVDKGSG